MKLKLVWISTLIMTGFFYFQPLKSQTQVATPHFIWPIRTANLDKKISSMFGESRKDHFHNGLDISSVNETVVSMESGMVLYSRYHRDNPFEQYLGPGNNVWIYHGGGYMSAYYHLKKGRKQEILQELQVQKGQKLGISGNTGHSSGAHLHFVLCSQFGKKIINPIQTLPQLKDSHPPKIGALVLRVENSFTYINDGDNINVSRAFPMSVRVIDRGEQPGQRRGIYQIRFTFDGQIIKESRFKFITLKDGQWINEDGLSFDELFEDDRYFIGELDLSAGEHIIRVDAYDYNNNSSSKQFRFHVNRI